MYAIRDWSLIMGRGGGYKTGRGVGGGGGGQVKFYPYKKGGRKRFSHAEGGWGGGTYSFEVVLTWEL